MNTSLKRAFEDRQTSREEFASKKVKDDKDVRLEMIASGGEGEGGGAGRWWGGWIGGDCI